MKNGPFFIDVQNVEYISDAYFCPNSIKIENQTASKVTRKEEPFNLNHAEPSEVKRLTLPVRLY